ncbi:sugar transferase [Pseudarthrobacter sp. J64]|uniref:sugar transferase n=1 Tax=Pseudarthrobacter sp. J64 TaxID=3116485 RepID=UPI002E811908|nr:sugar transferase [Pseudarthrobacter sp. J64]MEE2567922.1 sugar transferase [Pseudarthrobacter sp. J64]
MGIGSEEYRRIITATLSVFGALAIVSMLIKFDIARGYIAIALPLGLFGLLVTRRMWRQWLVRQRKQGNYCDLALLIGDRGEVAYVADQIARRPAAGYRVVASVLDNGPMAELDVEEATTADGQVLPVVGDLNSIAETVKATGANAVIVAGNVGEDRTFLKSLGWELEKTGTSLVLASRLTDIAGPRIHWRPIDGLPLMSVELPQYAGAKHSLKRLMDVVLAALALVTFAPVFLIVALLIKAEDRGPVFFRQPRVGVNGDEFLMHKFRSMRVDADSMVAELADLDDGNGKLFKIRNDPRVTKIGGFIRRYSLDELPQLWNVLGGTMSLVGPRPPLPREVAGYERHTHRRLNVRPGITGLWQVSGRSDLSWDESVRLDLYYVENWSPAGDMVILFKTVRAVVAKEGAY